MTQFRSLTIPKLDQVVGVDFSGAAVSGKTAWLAEFEVRPSGLPLRLLRLDPVGSLAGCDRRDAVCGYLVDRIRSSQQTAWGMDFPFGLPIELDLGSWQDQLEHAAAHSGDAREFGRDLVQISRRLGDKMHIRRVTDVETRTPFDGYHYRIIYQTFHGMRDVLRPLAADRWTAILPFQYERLRRAQRVVVEACPSSTLKRMQLPHRMYKQSGRRPPNAGHRKTRQTILRHLAQFVKMTEHRRRVMLGDPGGDALDAVIAGVGTWISLHGDDHRAIANHDRYRLEGRVFC